MSLKTGLQMGLRTVGAVDLWVEEGGGTAGGRAGGSAGGPTLLLMHGLSGTGALWSGLRAILEEKWPGRWIVPDMRGHGRSAHTDAYGIALHAADMAALTAGEDDLVFAGHSMGGLVAILLASGWFGVTPRAAVTLGVKISWTDDELAGVAKLIAAPVRRFATEAEARERFVLVTGLKGIVDPASDIARSGIVREEDGGWRLAADNRAASVAYADARDIYRAARAPVVLAAGGNDAMVPRADLLALDPDAVALPGRGHNAHVEDPEALWKLIANAAGVAP